MPLLRMLVFALSLIVLSGCTNPQSKRGGSDPLTTEVSASDGSVSWTNAGNGGKPANSTLPSDGGEPSPSYSPDSARDYAISLQGSLIALHDRNDEINLTALLGAPLTEETYTLRDADTLTGSFLQEITFPGLYMQLFSPKQDGGSFWIMNMRITDGSYITSKGLRVGMGLSDLQAVYPDLQPPDITEADPTTSVYEVGSSETYDYARYELQYGVIREIYFHYEIP